MKNTKYRDIYDLQIRPLDEIPFLQSCPQRSELWESMVPCVIWLIPGRQFGVSVSVFGDKTYLYTF